MPKKRKWTAAQDATIRQMCASGATWQAQAEKLDLNRDSVIARGRLLKVSPERYLSRQSQPTKAAATEYPNREALPAGDERTWGLLMPGHDYPDTKRKDQ